MRYTAKSSYFRVVHAGRGGLFRRLFILFHRRTGAGYAASDFTEAQGWGFTQFPAWDLWQQNLTEIGSRIRKTIGDHPVYVTYDIDSLDPAYAPGTGTPEIGGLTTPQALQLIHALQGMNVVGCDLVEVSPPYDPSGNTALTAANLLFELLCILPGVTSR